MPPVSSDGLRDLNDDLYRSSFRSRSCSMHCETERSHIYYALRFMISKPCRPGMLPGDLSLQVGLRPSVPCLAQLSSAHRSSTPAGRPIVVSGVSGWVDEAKNSAGINHAMYEIFAPSNPLRMPLWLILQRQSLFLCHSLLPRHRLPPFR